MQRRSGVSYIKSIFPKKQKLEIAFGEHIIDGKVRQKIDNRNFSVEVIVKSGENQYTNYFRRLGLRYIEIHSDEELEIEFISLLPCQYPLNKISADFPDPIDQKIYDTSLRTLELCMHDHYEDCPWREQALYTMDSGNQILCGYYAFKEFRFSRSVLYLMSQDNRKDRLLSICFPTSIDLTIPSFSFFYFLEVYEYTVYSGDITLFKSILPKMESIISAFLERRVDGLIQNFTDKHHWNFYEWVDGLNGNLGSESAPTADAALNCLCSLALSCLDKLYSLSGLKSDYQKIANEMNAEISFSAKRRILYQQRQQ
ncbi:MAG: hypothetical protein IJO74_07230 [Clostridia bacterium]|nr:hypothetical protein [Clostridia bacterium]